MGNWIKVNSIKEVPLGNWLVKIKREEPGNSIHVAEIGDTMSLVGQHFYWDMPEVYEYYSIPVNDI